MINFALSLFDALRESFMARENSKEYEK